MKNANIYSTNSTNNVSISILTSQFWSKIGQKSISEEFFKSNFGVKNWPIFVPKVSKEALWMGLRHFLRICMKNIVYREQRVVENQVTSVLWSTLQCIGFIILTWSVEHRNVRVAFMKERNVYVQYRSRVPLCRCTKTLTWVSELSDHKNHYTTLWNPSVIS